MRSKISLKFMTSNAQTKMDRSKAENSDNKHMAAHAIASSSFMSTTPSRAIDQAVFAICCDVYSWILARAAEDIESSNGPSDNSSFAYAHKILERPRGSKFMILRKAAADIKCIRGS